jgi:hypothetical protein
MTKHELMALFPAFSPKRAFREGYDGWELVGKHVNVAKVADDGEAWWQTKDADLLRRWLEQHRVLLGISKRRPLPERLRPVAFQRHEPGEVIHTHRVALEDA